MSVEGELSGGGSSARVTASSPSQTSVVEGQQSFSTREFFKRIIVVCGLVCWVTILISWLLSAAVCASYISATADCSLVLRRGVLDCSTEDSLTQNAKTEAIRAGVRRLYIRDFCTGYHVTTLADAPSLVWVLPVVSKSAIGTDVRVPLWLPFGILTLVGMVAMEKWRKRRLNANHLYCGNCRYDLYGNLTGVCPECGTSIPESYEGRVMPSKRS
jgi:hypothetical protein